MQVEDFHQTSPTNLSNMMAAEGLYRDLLDFENEALVIVSDSETILLAPHETRGRLQQRGVSVTLRELSDSALAAKYDSGTEKRQAFLLESTSPVSSWAPQLWSELKASGIDGILVLYDNHA